MAVYAFECFFYSGLHCQLNLEPTQPNGLVGCKAPTDQVKKKKPCTWVFILHNNNTSNKIFSTTCQIITNGCIAKHSHKENPHRLGAMLSTRYYQMRIIQTYIFR